MCLSPAQQWVFSKSLKFSLQLWLWALCGLFPLPAYLPCPPAAGSVAPYGACHGWIGVLGPPNYVKGRRGSRERGLMTKVKPPLSTESDSLWLESENVNFFKTIQVFL